MDSVSWHQQFKTSSTITVNVVMDGDRKLVTIGVVSNDTMSAPLLIGGDVLKLFDHCLTKNPVFDKAVSEMLHVGSEPNYSYL